MNAKMIDKLKSILDEDTVIVCIGTNKCIGDSLGPNVGSILEKSNLNNTIYGTIEDPIHGLNISERIPEIKRKHKSSTILAIDAATSYSFEVGTIRIINGPIKPGAGVNKKLESIGDYSIKGIVTTEKNDYMETIESLSNVQLEFITEMAEIIANSIIQAINSINEIERRVSYEL